MRAMSVFVASGVLLAVSVSAEPYIYPKDGQDAEQQAKDTGECQTWAKNNSGVDPNAPAEGPDRGRRARGAAGGAARGAAAGAVIGAIAGDAGTGAAVGAAAGGMRGRRGAMAGEQAQAAGEADSYSRAFAACMEGRGYTVK